MTNQEKATQGKIIIFTAPSGGGKTTLMRHILDTFDDVAFSVSATTRAPRPGEKDGVDYYFMDDTAFKKLIEEEAFLEYENFYGGLYYGTLYSEIERLWAAGKTVLFDVEVKGATNLKKAFPNNSLAVFIKPPTRKILFDRLRSRKTESAEALQRRMERAEMELTYEDKFDYLLINDKLSVAKKESANLVAEFLQQ